MSSWNSRDSGRNVLLDPRVGEALPEPHVIVGGGFGGLYAAFALQRRPVRVTLVDRHNYHRFPLQQFLEVTGSYRRKISSHRARCQVTPPPYSSTWCSRGAGFVP